MEKKDSRSLWKRVKETLKTIKPVEPGSYKARSLSIEAQRDNAINWLSKQPYIERKSEGFGSDIPDHLLEDQEFARELHERFGEKVADRVIPLEVRRSAEYQAATTENYNFLNAALKHDEVALQLPTKDHSENFSDTDKLHAIETVRRMGPEEALQFLTKELNEDPTLLRDQAEYMPGYAPKLTEVQRRALSCMSDEVLTDRNFLLAIDKAGVNLHALPQHIRDNDKLMAECVAESPFFFEVASKNIRSNQECLEASLKSIENLDYDSHEKVFSARSQAATNYSKASIELRSKAENFTLANSYSLSQVAVRDVPESIRNDKTVIEEQLLNDPNALRFASRELRKDRQFILNMTERYRIDVPRADLIKDRDIAANLARTDSVQLHNLPDDLKNDRDFVAQVVKLNPEQLEYAKPEFQDDYEIAYNAVSQKSDRYAALQHCSSRLQADPSIVYKAVESNGYNIIYASHDLQDNFAMGMHVVQNEPWAVKQLPINLRNNLEIAKEVIARVPSASTGLGEEVKKNLIASLSPEDKAQYDYWFTENEPEVVGRYISKGLEPYLIKLEREELETHLEEFREREVQRIKSSTELTNERDIKLWLDSYGVENYTINNDLTVDVHGDVNLRNKTTGDVIPTDYNFAGELNHTVVDEKLSAIPFQFGIVEGSFDISGNSYGIDFESSGLTSLKGAPREVKGDFDCSENVRLTDTDNLPKFIGGALKYAGTAMPEEKIRAYLIVNEKEKLGRQVAIAEQAPTLTAEQSVNKLLSDVLASTDLGVSSKPTTTPVAQAIAPTQSASPKRKHKI